VLAVGVAGGLMLWRVLSQPSQNSAPALRLLTYSGSDNTPAVSPDGSIVAFASTRDGRQRIWLKQIIGAGEAPLTEGPDRRPRFHPDGSSILFLRSEGLRGVLYRIGLIGGGTAPSDNPSRIRRALPSRAEPPRTRERAD